MTLSIVARGSKGHCHSRRAFSLAIPQPLLYRALTPLSGYTIEITTSACCSKVQLTLARTCILVAEMAV